MNDENCTITNNAYAVTLVSWANKILPAIDKIHKIHQLTFHRYLLSLLLHTLHNTAVVRDCFVVVCSPYSTIDDQW
jgi:hypothetical protein